MLAEDRTEGRTHVTVKTKRIPVDGLNPPLLFLKEAVALRESI
jgi:hypothetical protein